MRNGLVLEGGGLRGMFTAGILDVWMQRGIVFDGVVGVSAGATFGCNFVSRQVGRVIRYQLRFIHDNRYMSYQSLWRTGDLVGADFAYHYLPTHLDLFDFETFKQSPTQFHLVCTDANRGVPIYRHIKQMDFEGLEWLRASASMPIVSRPVELEGMRLLDGGITDSIPLRYFQQLGFQRNVVILTQPKGFRKRKTALMPFFHVLMRQYPAITRAMACRHQMYNEQLDYLAQQESLGQTLLICPDDTLPIGRTERNDQKIQHVYDMGRSMGEHTLDKVVRFLQS
ncbi:MAG: patatin family protein [Bacteroidaceae bacterium]|nr:patatin family protein [Bacteroidaceae bacterium]